MIKWEIRVLLAHYLEQGLSKSAAARQLGVDRRTINRWIARGELDRDVETGEVPQPVRSGRPTKLDPYKDIVIARLEKYPELTTVRLFDEIRAAGYPGGLTQLKLRAYQSLILLPKTPPRSRRPAVPGVEVERRALTTYAAIAAGAL